MVRLSTSEENIIFVLFLKIFGNSLSFLENGQLDLKSLPAQLDKLECGDVDWPLHRTL